MLSTQLEINPNEVLSTIFEDFENGHIDGIDCYLYVKKLQNIIDGIKSHDEIQNDVFVEVEKYAKGEKCIREGYEVNTMTRRNYKFSFDWYNKKKQEIKGLEEQAKALLNQGVPAAFIPDENGELQEVKAAEVSYSSSVIVSEIKR